MQNKVRKSYRVNRFTGELLSALKERIPVSETAIIQMAIYHYAKEELGNEKVNEIFFPAYLESEKPPTL